MTPFRSGDLWDTLTKRLYAVEQKIEQLSNEEALSDQQKLESRFINEIVVEPLVLRDNEKEMVRGTMDIVVPFDGDNFLWGMQPSRFTASVYPDIRILEGRIVFSLGDPKGNISQETLKRDLVEAINSLIQGVSELKPETDRYNIDAPGKIKLAIRNRRERALKNITAINSLGLPVRDKL